ncbi:Uncharacterised protein [Paenibacillus thiaminolyticus]|nr:Uncharacterised protein [Paenibacillus thiaminolyticus]
MNAAGEDEVWFGEDAAHWLVRSAPRGTKRSNR